MNNLEQTLREILTPQKVAAFLDVSTAIRAAEVSYENCGRIMLDLGTIIRDNQMLGGTVCQTCCFQLLDMPCCFQFCAYGEIFHFSEEVRKNLHPQTATSLENLCERKENL